MSLIIILDDEPDIVELISVNLKKAGFSVKGFLESKSFFNYIEKIRPDLLILDLMLPDSDGFEVCKELKRQEKFINIPIIMLTAKSDETDKVLGLELGADDYITKPFSPKELVARVKAILRRNIRIEKTKKIIIGKMLELDFDKYEAQLDGKRIDLTSTEMNILKLLASKKGWVFSRQQILNNLWGEEKAVLDRTIDVHIKNLREKIGKAGKYIKNVRGIGYKLEE